MPKETLLIVDDDQNFCQEIAGLFKDKYDIFSAASGMEAKKIISRNMINIALLDLKLPDLNGLELVEFIREKGKIKDTCIIIITAFADLKSAIKALREHVYDYVIKPVEPELLIRRAEMGLLKQSVERKLKDKLNELEKFQKVATGRELKMIELKKTIKNLREKVKEFSWETNHHKEEIENHIA